MSDLPEDVMKSFNAATGSMKVYNEALLRFSAACSSRNWKDAAAAHFDAVAAIDSYFIHIAAAYKRNAAAS